MKKLLTILLAITLIVSTSTSFVFATDDDNQVSSAVITAEDTDSTESDENVEPITTTETELNSVSEDTVELFSNAPSVTDISLKGEDISYAKAVRVSFSTSMDRSTLNPQNIKIQILSDGFTFPVDVTDYSQYDEQYVFVADFESYQTYRITVTTAVKSSDGTPLSEDYVHTFSTGEILIPANTASMATPSRQAGGAYSGADSELYKFTDGNTTKPWYNYGLGGAKNYGQLNFAKPVNIAYVAYYGYENAETGARILASNDEETWVELSVLPDADEPLKWIATTENAGEKYKHIRIQSTYICEIEVYTFVIPEVSDITPGSFGETAEGIMFADVAKVTFDTSMDMSTLNSENIILTDVTDGTVLPHNEVCVYNDSYVFTADFESDKEYMITVTTDVKALAGASIPEEINHRFTTGNLMLASNTAKNAVLTCRPNGGNASAVSSLGMLTDGVKNFKNSGTVWFNYGFGSGQSNWAQASYDKEQNIAYIVYYPYIDGNSGGNKITVSNDTESLTYTIPKSSSGSHPEYTRWIIPVDSNKGYKNVRVEATYIDEIEIFTYNIPEVTGFVPGNADELVTDVAVCAVEFDSDMDITTLTSENIIVTNEKTGEALAHKTPSLNAEAYDTPHTFTRKYVFTCDFEPGTTYSIKVKDSIKSVAGNPLREETTYTFTTAPYLYTVRNIAPKSASSYTISAGSNTDAGNEASLSKLYDGVLGEFPWFNFGGSSDKWITADLGEAKEIAFVSCMADHPEDPNDMQSDGLRIEVSNDPTFASGVVLLGKVATSRQWQGAIFHSAPSDGNKYRYVRVTDTRVLYVSELEIYEYYRDDPDIQAIIDATVTDFTSISNNNDFVRYIEKYTVTYPFFTLNRELPELDGDRDAIAEMGEYIKVTAPVILKESGNTLDDVKRAIKGGYVWYVICNNSTDSALKIFDKYGSVFSKYSDVINKSGFVKLMSVIKNNVTDYRTFEKAFDKAILYSLIQDADAAELTDVIKDNASLFGIDITYATEKNVTVTEIAKKLDTKNAAKYIDFTDAAISPIYLEFMAIADEIASSKSAAQPNRVSGGGGGGGGTAFSKNDYVNVPTKPDTSDKETANTVSFKDIEGVSWAKADIERLAEMGVISGRGDGIFDPDGYIRREEVAKILYLAFDFEDTKTMNVSFEDCERGAWYFPFVSAMYDNGIINGISENKFGTGANMTRQDFALMVYRIMTNNYSMYAEPASGFSDESKISDYASEALLSLAGIGVINGFADGTIGPMENITRAQAAVLLCNTLDYIATLD